VSTPTNSVRDEPRTPVTARRGDVTPVSHTLSVPASPLGDRGFTPRPSRHGSPASTARSNSRQDLLQVRQWLAGAALRIERDTGDGSTSSTRREEKRGFALRLRVVNEGEWIDPFALAAGRMKRHLGRKGSKAH